LHHFLKFSWDSNHFNGYDINNNNVYTLNILSVPLSCLRSKLQQQEGKTYILCLSLVPFYLSNALSENENALVYIASSIFTYVL